MKSRFKQIGFILGLALLVIVGGRSLQPKDLGFNSSLWFPTNNNLRSVVTSWKWNPVDNQQVSFGSDNDGEIFYSTSTDAIIFNASTTLQLQRNDFTKIELDSTGDIVLTPSSSVHFPEGQLTPLLVHDGRTADIAPTDFTIKAQDAFVSAVTNPIGADLKLLAGTGIGLTSENDGKVFVDEFQLEVKRTLDWGNTSGSALTDDFGSYFTFRGSGSDATRRIGLFVSFEGTYTGSAFTQALGFTNTQTGTSVSYQNDTSLQGYSPAGDRGIFGGSNAISAGIKSGVVALAGGSNNENYGVWGASTITRTFGQNIGVLGAAQNGLVGTGTEFAGAFVLGTRASQPVTRATSSALLVDNATLDEDILALLHNGVDVLVVNEEGNLEMMQGQIPNLTEITTATSTLASTDYHVSLQFSDTGISTSTLPAITATNNGQEYQLKDADYNANINNIVIATTGSDTIEEQTSGTMTAAGESWTLIANNTTKNWELQ